MVCTLGGQTPNVTFVETSSTSQMTFIVVPIQYPLVMYQAASSFVSSLM
jgi:hypothetical protein